MSQFLENSKDIEELLKRHGLVRAVIVKILGGEENKVQL
jgi:hypothetical protein